MKLKSIAILSLWMLTTIASAQGTLQDSKALGGRTFVYGEEVKLKQPIRIAPEDTRPLETILDEALKGTGIRYRITDKHVLLFAPATKKTYSLFGYVKDEESQETLIGANVYCRELQTGTVTNAYGFYSLPLPEGTFSVCFSYVGYEPQQMEVTVDAEHADLFQSVSLTPTRELQEVIVDSDRPETGVASTRTGSHTINLQQIERTPTLLGEADVIKTLQKLPGVTTGLAGSSQMSVRGGNFDQNLFLLDGILLYNVHHVLGFESVFMPDAVKHVDFFKGSFPARYGGRLSSVADVRTRDGDMQHYHGLFSIGLLSSHIGLEGPIVKDKTSFLFSARRSYAGWVMRGIIALQGDMFVKDFDLYFYDVNAKINHKFSDTNRLYLSFYNGRDGLRFKEETTDKGSYTSAGTGGQPMQIPYDTKSAYSQDMRWGNTFFSTRWNHIFSPSLFSNLTLGYNRFRMLSDVRTRIIEHENNELRCDYSYKAAFNSGIDDMMAIYDFDYHPTQQHHIKFGGSYTMHHFRPEVQTSAIRFKDEETSLKQDYKADNPTTSGHEMSLYLEDDMTLGSRWQMNAGLRGVAFAVEGKCYPALEPRFSATYLIRQGLRAKSSYSLMHQYVHQLTTSPISMPTDLWVSVNRDVKPMRANQWALGLAYNAMKGWEFSVEAYWKEMRNVLDYIDGASFYGSSKGWTTKVSSGEGRSKGIEFMASKTQGRTTGSLSYTLSKSDRMFPDGTINYGKRYAYEYDRRHQIDITLNYQLTDHIDLNASWNFASGGYATISKQKSIYMEPQGNGYSQEEKTWEGEYYSHRSNYKMKPRHQLDLSMNIHHNTKRGERIWNFSIINAYCHMNADLVWTEIKTDLEEVKDPVTGDTYSQEVNPRLVLSKMTIIPIIPSVSYTYKF